MNCKQTVVLVHGIWMTGLEMGWFGRQLAALGYDVRYFRYHSLTASPRESAKALQRFIDNLGVEQVHFVGHSLGGIILLHLFDLFPKQPSGRIVFLGSPVRGSQVAKTLSMNPVLRFFLGQTAEQGLLGGVPAWKGDRPLGVIAGNYGLGVGRLFGCQSNECDGTVAVSETRLPGADDFVVLPVSHMGMLFSRRVIEQTDSFLKNAKFNQGAGTIPAS